MQLYTYSINPDNTIAYDAMVCLHDATLTVTSKPLPQAQKILKKLDINGDLEDVEDLEFFVAFSFPDDQIDRFLSNIEHHITRELKETSGDDDYFDYNPAMVQEYWQILKQLPENKFAKNYKFYQDLEKLYDPNEDCEEHQKFSTYYNKL